jgi:integrase/recombinase XerC
MSTLPASFGLPPSEGGDLRVFSTHAPVLFSAGPNRNTAGFCQIQAHNDLEAVGVWLAEFAQSPQTFRQYRKEAIRLLTWASDYCKCPLSGLGREDIMAYTDFLAHPDPTWYSPDRPRHGPGRRLLEGPLSEGSIAQALRVLNGLFSYLREAGYLLANPLALARGRVFKPPKKPDVIERYLDAEQWRAVLDCVETFPQATARQQQHYERARFVVRFLYGTALRVSEAANARTADLIQRQGRWWLKVVGKGGVAGRVPVSPELLDAFGRYRRFCGHPEHPLAGENAPILLAIRGTGEKGLGPSTLYGIVKSVFRQTADRLRETDPHSAHVLEQASTHWLRHSSASHQADAGNDLRHIQKNLRHASIETTALYLHADEDTRHERTQQILDALLRGTPPLAK